MDFDRILCIDAPYPQGSEWPHETRHRLGYMAVPGGRLLILEGLSPAGDHPLQRAWVELGVPQCGFCQTGQIMCAASLLVAKPQPSDGEIDQALAGNLCRCGTYLRIRAAVKKASGQ